MSGLLAMLRKETLQMLRDRSALMVSLFMPVFQLVLFGLIDMNVKHVPTAVLDLSRTAESRALVRDFVNTSYFDVVAFVDSHEALRREITAGRVSAGIEIPPEYARRRMSGRPADVLVLIDGSDSTIANQTMGAANGLALSRSLEELSRNGPAGGMAVRTFPQLLFNPGSRSANLLIPGMIAILLTFSGTILAAFSIVKERERGTLEQLLVTPVSAVGVMAGKLVPYLALGFAQLLVILWLMTRAFDVPIHGSLLLLLTLSVVYLFALSAIGLVISAGARSQADAIQKAQALILPSIFLSGYVFPISALPRFLQVVSQVVPATHFIAITRGIVIRGASLADLWPNVVALVLLCALLVAASTRAFRKTVA